MRFERFLFHYFLILNLNTTTKEDADSTPLFLILCFNTNIT